MTAVVEASKKKAAKKASAAGGDAWERLGAVPAAIIDGEILTDELDVTDTPPSKPARVSSKKPGEPGYDWVAEYPDEEVFVFTTKSGEVTIGLTKIGEKRKPKPGVLRRVNAESREAGNAFPVLWYFLELASSPASLKAQELLEDDEYADMLKQWTEFSELDLGE